ncbi:PepSY domain-containing protein [Methylobacterium sp. B4]|uniref:PepSY domain-containing protein n=1 Tax=Methylobacterium sp. B4 TaxID=1938755 RepID=UPI000D827B50|nr:PepSY domain-containing protein [Methylobacterium sp. B4]PXW50548.1 TonB-dependent receptor-like protein [Methylobacterium sp. B4]
MSQSLQGDATAFSAVVAARPAPDAVYRAVWRWHFYAGLLCLPFLVLLSATGSLYLFKDEINGTLFAYRTTVVPQAGRTLSPDVLLFNASQAEPAAVPVSMAVPAEPTATAVVTMADGPRRTLVYLNPYNGDVLDRVDRDDEFMMVVRRLHRDVVVSIRGNNARATGVSRNMVVLEDGFPVTQADGSSRFDLVDPRAYSRIDVFRGPQSPFFGNFATGGALNFVTRRGSEINGVEYGVDAGSFGYLNNYAAFGGVSGPFEYSLFTSDTRGNGFISHNSFDTQTINFLGTYTPTPDDRFTLKIINNGVATDLPGRGSLNQFRLNPFQRGCASAAAAAPGCVTYNLLLNGRNGATVPVTADEGAFFRGDRRTIVGGRWEHDFDAFTTWRTQLVFDDRQINQPFYTTAARGDFPGFNFLTDVTRRGDLFGLPATGYVALAYNTLDSNSLTYNRAPYGGPRLGALTADLEATQANLGGRARVELQLAEQWIAVAGISAENTTINGRNITYGFPAAGGVTTTLANIDRSFLNVAPELSLLYRPDTDWQFRGRVATGYATL